MRYVVKFTGTESRRVIVRGQRERETVLPFYKMKTKALWMDGGMVSLTVSTVNLTELHAYLQTVKRVILCYIYFTIFKNN